jgi:hypothetical protein
MGTAQKAAKEAKDSAGHEGGQRRGAGIAAKERFFAFTK